MKADWFALMLLVLYVLATLMYLFEGNWSKVLYFGGSAVITISILMAN